MVTTETKKLSFEEYLRIVPEDGKFELVNGELVKIRVIRAYKNISRFLVTAFDRESERLGLDFIVDKDIVIRTISKKGEERGRIPDVSVVKASIWNANVSTYLVLMGQLLNL